MLVAVNPTSVSYRKMRNRKVEERVKQILIERRGGKWPKTLAEKYALAQSLEFAANCQAIKPPSVPGKFFLTAINLDSVEKPGRGKIIAERYLKSAYNGLELEIKKSADGRIVFFFANKRVDFKRVGSNKHPLCRPGEILRAKPCGNEVQFFERQEGRLVRLGGTNLYFEKA
ncbi:MAG: hypothetical protein PHO56_02910 [Patescibacteria group bacterium]|nr:hypothetical protein [Patescibacteria group bacterium]